MESLVLLIPLSVLAVFAAGLAFWWSAHSGQFDDLDGPAHRVLADDDTGAPAHASDVPALTPIKFAAGAPGYDAGRAAAPQGRPAAKNQ
jgi:cbb3-type cytochrome oxidase maturation protein